MEAPPLLSSRPPAARALLAIVVPAVFGGICGLLLGLSAPAYIVASVLGVAGGLGAGFEHEGGGEGARRGVLGGILFGAALLAVHEATGEEATVALPEPAVLLAVLTGLIGSGLGALGGRARDRRAATAPAR